MSGQKLVQPTTPGPVLPKQPEVNIGSSGHVDHGKCLTPDQFVVVDGELMSGYEIIGRLKSEGVLLNEVDGGATYQVGPNRVVSLDQSLRPVQTDSLVFVQEYSGPIYAIKTRTGRSVSVTPEHPLLVNRSGKLIWVKARDLTTEDSVAFARMIPLDEDLRFPAADAILRHSYEVITWMQSEDLRAATDGFTNFATLNGKGFELVRLMAGMPKRELARLLRMNRSDLNKVLSGQDKRAKSLERLAQVFKRRTIASLTPNELILASKKKHAGTIVRLREPEFDADLVKWLAFVLAAGHINSARVEISQKVQSGMLEEFLGITERKFGLTFKRVGKIDYHLNSRPLVDYLRAKYSIEAGPKRVANVPGWLLRLPAGQKALFLRWFLTLDGEFNRKTGQISITQANRRSIVLFGYLFGSFGMVPRFSSKKTKTVAGIVEYHRLSISGRRDLATFARLIGFEDHRIQRKLLDYLSKISVNSKETDLSIPVDREALKALLERLGAAREAFRPDPKLQTMKEMQWYKAFEGARYSGRMSRQKLLGILNFAEQHLRKLELALAKTKPTRESVLRGMSLTRLSQIDAASRLGVGRKVLARLLRDEEAKTLKKLDGLVRDRINEILSASTPELNELKRLANAPLEYDRILSIEVQEYSGTIFDLSVPRHANFLGGVGAIVCHNTTTVQAITGVWASAHSEELRRGITIKVGYADAAFYRCPTNHGAGSYSTSTKCPIDGKETALLRAVSFVDTPGHESLMTNMLAGAFLMDGALLVVAANEPVPKPQTREHLQALQMLGMKRIVIAQNKIDLVTDAEAKKNYAQIQKFVEGTVAEAAPIVPISAQQRLNIDALIEALQEVVPTPKRDTSASPLMYVVRSFDVNRPGAEIGGLVGGVLGGSLTRGELRVGDEIEVRPGMVDERSGKFVPIVTRVSSLQTGAGPAQKVGPGGLVAVGTHLDPTFVKGDQMVGSVIGKPGTLPETLEHVTLDVALLETAVGAAELVRVERVKLGETVRLNLGTASTLATATSVRGDVVELDLKKPVAVEKGMRAAISRRIAERWRLIGSGVLK